MRENDVIAGNYRIIKEIGRGGTGTVFLGYHLHLQKYVVLKEMPVTMGDERLIRTEADILKNLHHEYLPQVYDFLLTDTGVITVLDYVEGNDLSSYMCGPQNLSEEQLLTWLTQMAEVLSYLHGNDPQVVHSDIKPGNVIVRPNGDICLIDFNISLLADQLTRVIGFSAQFASPEQYYLAQKVSQGDTPQFALDPSTDIYSTGALLYYLMTGIYPTCVMPNTPLSEMGDTGYSSSLVNIVDKCLQWDRSKRYRDGSELLDAVTHYRKQSDSYKRKRTAGLVLLLLAAVLIGAGTYGFTRRRENTIRQEYRQAYAEVGQKLREGDDHGAEETGLTILDDGRYQRFLEQNPQDHADLLHAMGDVHYQRGDYAAAADYYRQALLEAEGTGADLTVFYRDCAISLARAGQVTEARAYLQRAQDKGLAGPSMRLIEISCAYMEGDHETCMALAREMENDSDADADEAARAAYFAGMACQAQGNNEERIAWLTKAAESGNILYQKALADAFWELAGDREQNETQQQLYAVEACRIYETICSDYYQTYENLLNLAIIQHYLQEYGKSQLTLEKCKEQYPVQYENDYHLSMYLAFLYEETGRQEDARYEAMRALEILEKAGGAADAGDAKAIDRLRSLANH